MSTLSFDSGIKTYTVNGKCEISVPLLDDFFKDAFQNAVDKCLAITEWKQYQLEAVKREPKKKMEIVREKDAAIRKELDAVFGEGTAEKLFPYSTMTPGNGFPAWANFCMAVMEEMDRLYTEQEGVADERIQYYMDKFRKYTEK